MNRFSLCVPHIIALMTLTAFLGTVTPAPVFAKSTSKFQEALKKLPVVELQYEKVIDNKTIVKLDLDVPSVFKVKGEFGHLTFDKTEHLKWGRVDNKPHRFWMLGTQKGFTSPAIVFDRQGNQIMALETRTIIKNEAFIMACYLIVGLFISALTWWVFNAEKRQQQRLENL